MAKRKLQVFVSSTYLDLLAERQAAVQAILRAGHIPAGMELFAAGDQSQMEVIQRWIDESDVYMLILGARYGSVDQATSKSYTQLEYEYAVKAGKPLFACVINDAAIDERVRTMGRDAIDDNGIKLKAFRTDVLSRMSGLWVDAKDIALTIFQSLSDFERQENLSGWIKGDQALDPVATEQMAQEIARLSAENNNLRERISAARGDARFSGLTYAEVRERLRKLNLLEEFFKLRDQPDIDAAVQEMPPTARELFTLGLLESATTSGGFRYYFLSDEGKAFLNMYAVEQDRAETLEKG
jgi:hypothetical protein